MQAVELLLGDLIVMDNGEGMSQQYTMIADRLPSTQRQKRGTNKGEYFEGMEKARWPGVLRGCVER
jgi:hypothetical protein